MACSLFELKHFVVVYGPLESQRDGHGTVATGTYPFRACV